MIFVNIKLKKPWLGHPKNAILGLVEQKAMELIRRGVAIEVKEDPEPKGKQATGIQNKMISRPARSK